MQLHELHFISLVLTVYLPDSVAVQIILSFIAEVGSGPLAICLMVSTPSLVKLLTNRSLFHCLVCWSHRSATERSLEASRRAALDQFANHGSPTAWISFLGPICHVIYYNNLSLIAVILFHVVLFIGDDLAVHKVPLFTYLALHIGPQMLCVFVSRIQRVLPNIASFRASSFRKPKPPLFFPGSRVG
jgi:hypothetical protein